VPEPTAAASYQRPRVRRGRLSRQVVVAAALELIDTEGLGGLSMRRVGQRLKVEAMSLYGYVANREALLDAVVDSIIDELWADPEVVEVPQDGWQDYLSRLAWGVRRFAIAHPRAFPLVATRPPEAPFVRPPLRSLRWLEEFLTALRQQGFTDEAVLYAYRAFTIFLLGNLLQEAGARSAEDPAVGALPSESLPPDAPNADAADPADRGEDVRQPDVATAAIAGAPLHDATTDEAPVAPITAAVSIDEAQYPVVAEFAGRLGQDHAEQEFTDGLRDLLDRLATHPGVPVQVS